VTSPFVNIQYLYYDFVREFLEPLAKLTFCKSNGVGRLRPTRAVSGVKYCQRTSHKIQSETAEGREQTCSGVLPLAHM